MSAVAAPIEEITPPADAPIADQAPAATPADTPAPDAEATPSSDTPTEPAPDGVKPADEAVSPWPENWREEALASAALTAEQRKAAESMLKRYGSVGGVVKALVEKDAYIRSGKIKRDMPDPTDEKAVAEWRREQGIPDKPEAYKAPTVKGFEWSDEDKPMMASFFEHAHQKGMPQNVVDMGLEWYAGMVQNQMEQIRQADETAHEAAEDTLRREWPGAEFKRNMSIAKEFLSTTPLGADWAELRTADGRKLGNIPEFVSWAADLGRDFVGGGAHLESGDGRRSGSTRLEEIERIMRDNIDLYRRDYEKEHVQLLEAEARRRR